jgi:hypothetical protein
MKKIVILIGMVGLLLCASPVLAADEQSQLPTRLTYAIEWLNMNLFTWKAESKVKTLGQYAGKRVDNAKAVFDEKAYDQIEQYANAYNALKARELQIMEQKKLSNSVVEEVKTRTIEQQKTLSIVRDGLESADLKQSVVSIQERVTNRIKNVIESTENKENADKFINQIVTVWEDPQGTKDTTSLANGTTAGEAAHTYAAGTTAGGVNGVIVDGGQGKIVKGTDGEVKIVYAPGTGPSSVTQDSGKKVWTIQNSDGSTSQGSGASGNVIQGGSSGTAGTVIEGTNSGVVTGTSGGQSTNDTGGGQVVNGNGQGGTTVVGE